MLYHHYEHIAKEIRFHGDLKVLNSRIFSLQLTGDYQITYRSDEFHDIYGFTSVLADFYFLYLLLIIPFHPAHISHGITSIFLSDRKQLLHQMADWDLHRHFSLHVTLSYKQIPASHFFPSTPYALSPVSVFPKALPFSHSCLIFFSCHAHWHFSWYFICALIIFFPLIKREEGEHF